MMTKFQSESIVILARVLAERYGVRVYMAGDSAFTKVESVSSHRPSLTCDDNRESRRITIMIPEVETTNPLYRTLVRTYIDHEVGHVRYTDWDWLSTKGLFANRLMIPLHNIFEDIYVERQMMRTFPGCVHTFTRGVGAVFGKEDVKFTEAESIETVIQYVLYYMRSREATGAAVKPVADRLREHLCTYSAEGVDAVEAACMRGVELFSTAVCYEAAEKVMKVIYQHWKSPWEDSNAVELSSPYGDHHAFGMGETEARAGGLYRVSADMGRALNDAMKNFLTENSEESRVEREMEKWEEAYDKAHPGQEDSTKKGVEYRLAKEKIIERVEDTPAYIHIARGCAGCYTSSSTMTEMRSTAPGGFLEPTWKVKPLTSELLAMGDRTAAKLSAMMQSIAQARTLKKWRSGRVGDVNYRALWRPQMGRADMFLSRSPERGFNAEVLVLVDNSGSMGYSGKAEAASLGCYALVKTLSQMRGVKYWVATFSTRAKIIADNAYTKNLFIVPDGGTYMQYGLDLIPQLFSDDDHAARYVFLLSDGETRNPELCVFNVKTLAKYGVKFAGLEIMDDNFRAMGLARHCAYHEQVWEVGQLPNTMVRMMKHLLFDSATC